MTLRISATLELPDDAALWTFACLAIKGAGKTYGASVLAEELVKHNIPIIVIDGVGVWWGLRVGVNEKGEPSPKKDGFKIVVFGGQHSDLPIPTKQDGKGRKLWTVVDEDKLRLMVKALLEAGISAVIDMTGFSKNMKHRIVATFIGELMRLYEVSASTYGPRHIFLEEAHTYCPQREVKGDVAVSTGAIESLVMQGGNYNLGCTLITQRSASLNKNVLSQASCLIVLRILHQLDKNAVKAWVESMADPKDPKLAKWYDGLRSLKNGEAWVWNPEPAINIYKKIRFRPRETLHATREYFRRIGKPVKPTDVSEFVDRFKNVFEPKVKEPPKPPIIPTVPFQPNPITGQALSSPKPPSSLLFGVRGDIAPIGPITAPQGQPRGDVVAQVTQATPIIQLTKIKPNIQLDLNPLQEPTSPLGRVCAVLAGSEQRDDRWSVAKIRSLVRAHAWDDDGVNEVVDELVRWEILRKQSNGYIRFYRDRVQVTEATVTVGAQ